MHARTHTVAFEGVSARIIDVQCSVAQGLPSFSIVGLPDKAVSEAKERVRAAFSSLQIALPSKKLVINLSPADLPKMGSHFDLPIAIAVLAATGLIPPDKAEKTLALGELSLDGGLMSVKGCLPAALTAAENELNLICPQSCAPEAAWVHAASVYGAQNLGQFLRHFTGDRPLHLAEAGEVTQAGFEKDLRDVKGQERAKRALEIAAAGGHHFLMVGEPGSGKSMLAARLPTILPPLTPKEALDTSLIHSIAGLIDQGGISRARPFRAPHHTASVPAIIGGGRGAQPGEVSLAHNGVLFLDELPEFPRPVLETLRQPIETGEVMVARANAHVTYPAEFMLIAAANPCRCGYQYDANRACGRAPLCGDDYLGRISGPLMDRFDLRLEVPAVERRHLDLPATGDPSEAIRARVLKARAAQATRFESGLINARLEGTALEEVATPDAHGRAIMAKACEKYGFSARAYHRILRVARTIADLEGAEQVGEPHVLEAISYRIVQSPMPA